MWVSRKEWARMCRRVDELESAKKLYVSFDGRTPAAIAIPRAWNSSQVEVDVAEAVASLINLGGYNISYQTPLESGVVISIKP